MEIIETNVNKLNKSEFASNVIGFIELLQKQRFKKVTLSCKDNVVLLTAYFHDKVAVNFEVGQENVYLKSTPFWTKDSQQELIDLVFKLYYLD